mgnify:CR=1 FL=1
MIEVLKYHPNPPPGWEPCSEEGGWVIDQDCMTWRMQQSCYIEYLRIQGTEGRMVSVKNHTSERGAVINIAFFWGGNAVYPPTPEANYLKIHVLVCD